MKNLFTLVTALLLAPQLFATGNNSGVNCNNAYTYIINQDLNYQFQQGQDLLYFDFYANSNGLILGFEDIGQGSYAHMVSVDLYLKNSCSNLSLVHSFQTPDSSHAESFDFNNVINGNTYLLKIRRNPTQQNLTSGFNMKILHKAPSGFVCGGPLNSCNDEIEASDFWNHYVNYNGNDPFGSGDICYWEDGIGSPQFCNNGYQPNVRYAIMHYSKTGSANIVEGIMTDVDMEIGKTYTLQCSIRVNQRPRSNTAKCKSTSTNGTPPNEVKAVFMSASTVAAIPKPTGGRTFSDVDNVAAWKKQEIIVADKVDMTSSWEFFKVCFTAAANYDKVIFYPELTVNTTQSQIDITKISVTKVDNSAGADLPLCRTGSSVIGPNCNSASYSWSPATGLSNPNVFNPTAKPTVQTEYTLTSTVTGVTRGSTCTLTDKVIVEPTYDIIIPDGQGTAWLKSRGIHTGGSGTNRIYISDQQFYLAGLLNIDQDITFTNCNFYMNEDAQIIVNGVNLSIENTDSEMDVMQTCDDTKFWKGIKVDGSNGGSLFIDGRDNAERKIKISNAAPAIHLYKNPSTYLLAISFDRNNVAIKSEEQGSTFNVKNIYNCKFDCSTPLLNSSGNAFYPQHAVTSTNEGTNLGLVISPFGFQPSGTKTEFYGEGGNLKIEKASIQIQQAVFAGFNHIPMNLGAPGKSEIALDIEGKDNSDPNNYSAYIAANEFFNNNTSIESSFDIELDIANNKINFDGTNYSGTLLDYDVFVKVFGNSDPILIDDNNINNVYGGIRLYDVIDARVVDNKIDMDVQSGTSYTSKSDLNEIGIYLNNHQISIASTNTIELNTIRHAKTGIFSTNAQATIKNNNILDLNDRNFTDPYCTPFPGYSCPTILAYGIRIDNSPRGVLLKENKVELDPSNYTTSPKNNQHVFGISLENTANSNSLPSKLHCNKVDGMGIGLNFRGSNDPATEVYKNTMQNHSMGFVLSNNGYIGNVGSNGSASDNKWNSGISSNTFSSMSNGNQCKLYVRTSASSPYNPTINLWDASPGSTILTKDVSGNSPNTLACNAPARLRAPQSEAPNPITFNTNKELLTSKPSYMVHAGDSALRLSRQLLYVQLINDGENKSNTNWKNFADSVRNTPLGELMEGNSSLLTLGNSLDHFDLDMITIQKIQLKIKDATALTKVDSISLFKVANLCPYYDGIAVYQARDILQRMGIFTGLNQCELITKRLKSDSEVLSAETADFKLYPNPSNKILNISTTAAFNYFLIRNVVGQKLFEGKDQTIDISQLEKGIYFISFFNDQLEVVSTIKFIKN